MIQQKNTKGECAVAKSVPTLSRIADFLFFLQLMSENLMGSWCMTMRTTVISVEGNFLVTRKQVTWWLWSKF